MGRDKALLEVGGVPMAVRVAAALRDGGCDEVVAIGGDVDALASLGLPVVADEHPGEGPLGGALTALHALGAGVDVVVITACDLPHLGGTTVATLVEALDPPFEAAVAVPAGAHLPALCVAWNVAAVGSLDAAFAAGERRMTAVLDLVPHVKVSVEPRQLSNMNAPDDLRQ